MTKREDITYFGAGPALLPTDVLETAAAALVNYEGTGLGLAEHSHRGAHATAIIDATKSALHDFLDVPRDAYDIVFMQGGGTGEFAATAYHMAGAWVARHRDEVRRRLGLGGDEKENDTPAVVEELRARAQQGLRLNYAITGSWSLKAYQEAARLFGPQYVHVAADARKAAGRAGKFGTIPPSGEWDVTADPAMVYYCDNETVDGVEFPEFPAAALRRSSVSQQSVAPVAVADMSSNILSRRFAARDNLGLFFFGAQKNLGCAGLTVAAIDRRLLPPHAAQPPPDLMRQLGLPVPPVVFSYEAVAKNNSLYNTLSVFDVYVAGQVLEKLLRVFPGDKIDGQEALAGKKAALLYAALDAHPDRYAVPADKAVRSRMNICFRVVKDGLPDESAEKAFLLGAEGRGLTGLKGHRSVGGIRASNYNSVPLEGVAKLVRFIDEFAG